MRNSILKEMDSIEKEQDVSLQDGHNRKKYIVTSKIIVIHFL